MAPLIIHRITRYCLSRTVAKISSFWVNTTSKAGIKQLGICCGSTFLPFFMKVIWGHLHSNQGIPWSPAQNDSPGCQEDRHNQRDYDRSDHHLPSFDQLTACPGTSKVNIWWFAHISKLVQKSLCARHLVTMKQTKLCNLTSLEVIHWTTILFDWHFGIYQ